MILKIIPFCTSAVAILLLYYGISVSEIRDGRDDESTDIVSLLYYSAVLHRDGNIIVVTVITARNFFLLLLLPFPLDFLIVRRMHRLGS